MASRATSRDPRLACAIGFLDLPARARKACRQLRVETVGDFLSTTREAFLALRNCGERSYRELSERVERYLAATDLPTSAARYLQQPLSGLTSSPRAERAFQQLGLHTVADFLRTPKRDILAIPGFGERTYGQIADRIRALTDRHSSSLDLLPPSLSDLNIEEIGLPTPLLRRLDELGVACIGDLFAVSLDVLSQDTGIGVSGIRTVRSTLDSLVRAGIDNRTASRTTDFENFLRSLTAVLSESQAALLRHRLGLTGATAWNDIVVAMRSSHEEVHALAAQTRQTLRERARPHLDRLREEADREFRAFEGMVHCDHLAPGTILHDAGRATGDRLVPLRLLQFCFAERFFRYGLLLVDLSPEVFRKLNDVLRDAAAPENLPRQLSELENIVRREVGLAEPPHGLLLHLLREQLRLSITIDPQHGERIERTRDTLVDRLYSILQSQTSPANLEDLLFHYRDRHGRGRLETIVEKLDDDSRFLQVGRKLWDLRERHEDELLMAVAEAERIAANILDDETRLSVLDVASANDIGERGIFMILDNLRRNPGLRYLGRGQFCSASASRSTVMVEIARAFKRAMGEVVLTRFLQNQAPERRRLVTRLLRENRDFIEPALNRVDLLSNYPLNEERLQRLTAVISEHLHKTRGYASAEQLVGIANEADLGGEWLNGHLLRDLLARNSDFELLPGGLVALPSLGLGGWIQQKAREALRYASQAMTPGQILAEAPELVSFEGCLRELLDRDPMVLSRDGEHYSVI